MNDLPTADEFYIQLGFMPNHHQLGYDIKTAMIEYAKLNVQKAKETLYTEEEVLELLNDCRGENPIDISKWFEQFKKD